MQLDELLYKIACEFLLYDTPYFPYVIGGIIAFYAIAAISVIYYCYSKKHPYKQPSSSITNTKEQTLAEQKGNNGEIIVSNDIAPFGCDVHLINDVIITEKDAGETGDNTNQIDHVLVNDRGVIVIETKNLAGTICGTKDQTYWTQYFDYGGRYSFYNPVKQNATHTINIGKYLECQFPDQEIPIFSLVVFVQNNVGRLTIKNVINLTQLPSAIKRTGIPNTLSPTQIDAIATQLRRLKNKNSALAKQHIQYVQSIKNS